jgi:ABC-type phosphate transport system permease subunit
MKNGYSVRYRDPYLIQLTKRRQLDIWLLVLLVALGVVAAIVVVAILRQLLRERWHVVELTETPDKRIIMHKMWSPRPPDD